MLTPLRGGHKKNHIACIGYVKVVWWSSLSRLKATYSSLYRRAFYVSLYLTLSLHILLVLVGLGEQARGARVWLAGWRPEQPSLKALSVPGSRCTLRPPVCLPGWPTLATTICALLNTFCHCHAARHVHWWSLSDSLPVSLFQPTSLIALM